MSASPQGLGVCTLLITLIACGATVCNVTTVRSDRLRFYTCACMGDVNVNAWTPCAGPFWAQAVNQKKLYLQIGTYKTLHFRPCKY